ncbi:MAG: hypothetical protein L3J05_10560, partial [Robiginitomaculum sp.]|nr:hypothetical protein [Robiginitomaculum sp.]
MTLFSVHRTENVIRSKCQGKFPDPAYNPGFHAFGSMRPDDREIEEVFGLNTRYLRMEMGCTVRLPANKKYQHQKPIQDDLRTINQMEPDLENMLTECLQIFDNEDG